MNTRVAFLWHILLSSKEMPRMNCLRHFLDFATRQLVIFFKPCFFQDLLRKQERKHQSEAAKGEKGLSNTSECFGAKKKNVMSESKVRGQAIHKDESNTSGPTLLFAQSSMIFV